MKVDSQGRSVGMRHFSRLDVMVDPATNRTVPCLITPSGRQPLKDGDAVDLLLPKAGRWTSEPPAQDTWIHVVVREIDGGWFYTIPMQHQDSSAPDLVGEGWVDGMGKTLL